MAPGAIATAEPTPGDAAPADPTPPPAPGSWSEALTFAGDVQGTMYEIDAGGPGTQSECTGAGSRTTGAWALTLFGPVGSQVYGVVISVQPYRGPGVYRQPALSVQVTLPDASKVWTGTSADPATLLIDANEQTGTIDATLTDVASNVTKLHLSGHWACVS